MTAPANPPPSAAPPHYSRFFKIFLAVVLGVLLGLLVNAINYSQNYDDNRHKARCALNLFRIAEALQAYAADNNGLNPPSLVELFPVWLNVHAEQLFVCPGRGMRPSEWPDRTDDFVICCYRYVAYPTNATQTVLAGLPIMFDRGTNHLYKGMNVLFGNGQVKWETRPAFIAELRNMSADEKLPPGCREVLKQTLKTVEEDDGKSH